MKKNQQKVQVILISVGVLLIIFTYFNPFAANKKFVDDKNLYENYLVVADEKTDTRFEDI